MILNLPTWLNLADNTDRLTITLRTVYGTNSNPHVLYSRTLTKLDQLQANGNLLNIDSGEQGFQLTKGKSLELLFQFQTNGSTQTTVGAMIGKFSLQAKRTVDSNSCNNQEIGTLNRLGLNLGYRVPGKEQFYIRREDPRTLFDLQKTGINWVRFVFYPEQYDDSADGLYDLDHDRYRYMINNLCDRKIKLIPVVGIESIIGIGEQQKNFLTTYRFVNLEAFLDADIANPHSFKALFKKRLEELTQKYPEMTDWEILNEPDLIPYFQTDPGRLSEILAIAKSVLGGDNIIFGGLSNTWDDKAKLFLEKEYEAQKNRLSNSYDQLGVHPYTDDGIGRGIDPRKYFYDSNGRLTVLNSLIDVMKSNDSYGAKTIQITEFGFNTATPKLPEDSVSGANPCEMEYQTLVSEQEQADYLQSGTELLLNYNAPSNAVDKVIWYRYDDIYYGIPWQNFNPTCRAQASWQEQRVAYLPISQETAISRQSGEAVIQHWFGILDPFGNEKPAYCALQQLTGVKTVCQLSNRSHSFYLPLLVYTDTPLPTIRTISETVPTAIRQSLPTFRARESEQLISFFLFFLCSLLTILFFQRRSS